MKKITISLCLIWTLSAQAETVLQPLGFEVSTSQTQELSVVMVSLAAHSLFSSEEKPFKPSKWFIRDTEGVLDQICFSMKSSKTKEKKFVFYGLMRKQRDTQLLFYESADLATNTPRFSVPLPLTQATLSSSNLLKDWAEARSRHYFMPYASRFEDNTGNGREGRLFETWDKIAAMVYGYEPYLPFPLLTRQDRWRDLSTFSLFSGEAAVQETLQQQLLDVERPPAMGDELGTEGKNSSSRPENPPQKTLADLSGPDIPSHPFAKMLNGQAGGELPIARYVPKDHWFVHLTHPAKALTWLEELSQLGQQLAGLQQENHLDYDLIQRYLKRLHLSTLAVETLGKMTQQAALFGPDLYLTHGSEITLIAQMSPQGLGSYFLKLLPGLKEGGTIQTYGNDPLAYLAIQGEWLILSTSQQEAQTALRLFQPGAEEGLGASAEFRYMLSQLPPSPDHQQMFVYFSDPFIRKMVGPQIKIAQYRRQLARVRLENTMAAPLLYQLDHHQSVSLETLLQKGYLKPAWLKSWDGDQISLDAQGISHSSLYGDLNEMTPLSALVIDKLEPIEVQAYQNYVTEYSRYWRTYFDPIGIRITWDSPIRIETLILPLIENSAYHIVQASIGGEPVPLVPPNFEPRPVSMFSLKLLYHQEIPKLLEQSGLLIPDLSTWQSRGYSNVHVMLYDSAPLLTLGSSELLGVFSNLTLLMPNNHDTIGLTLFGYGLLSTLLTQPAAVWVELDKQTQAPHSLEDQRSLITGFLPMFRDPSSERGGFALVLDYRAEDQNWIYTLNIQNVVRLHVYLQVLDNYLVISNQPIHLTPGQSGASPPPANARLEFNFDQIHQLAPLLNLHTLQRLQKSVRHNTRQLIPFFLLGAKSIADAQSKYQQFYGHTIKIPSGDEWLWDSSTQTITSRAFGKQRASILPAADTLGERGPFDKLNQLRINFSFEEAGVRGVIQIFSK